MYDFKRMSRVHGYYTMWFSFEVWLHQGTNYISVPPNSYLPSYYSYIPAYILPYTFTGLNNFT